MIKAPKLTKRMMYDLSFIIRWHYASDMGVLLAAHQGPDMVPESMSLAVRLMEVLLELERPLMVAMDMLDMGGQDSALLPLNEGRFSSYEKILSMPLQYRNTEALSEERQQKLRALESARLEVQKAFSEAVSVNPETFSAKVAPKAGMLN